MTRRPAPRSTTLRDHDRYGLRVEQRAGRICATDILMYG